ncbi:MAG TPA: methyltransferase [Dongiaceae bacterium]|nr:methyltransferase [Dongiaceae bacterium]
MDRLEAHRQWFARLITASAGVPPTNERLVAAFASVPRERFLGPGPWQVFTRSGYVETPSDDPALIYQDVTVAIKKESQVNNGQPMLHAACLAALDVKEGETVVHVGAGGGYYSAILATLAGPTGRILAYEIDPELAARARTNLAGYPNVEVRDRSGADGALTACDALYVNAGATAPLDAWVEALRPGGRLLFPLTPAQGPGYMFLITRTAGDRCAARFVCGAMFIPCIGARDDDTARRLSEAFAGGGIATVRSLRRGSEPDATSWFAGRGWWLSMAAE